MFGSIVKYQRWCFNISSYIPYGQESFANTLPAPLLISYSSHDAYKAQKEPRLILANLHFSLLSHICLHVVSLALLEVLIGLALHRCFDNAKQVV